MEWKFNNDMPIYSQLVYQIKFAIVSGELGRGEKLAGVRELAAEAGVNPNTMQRAMQQLERDRLVFTQRNSGRFVTEDSAVIDQAKAALAKQYIDRFLEAMAKLGYGRDEIIQLLSGSFKEE